MVALRRRLGTDGFKLIRGAFDRTRAERDDRLIWRFPICVLVLCIREPSAISPRDTREKRTTHLDDAPEMLRQLLDDETVRDMLRKLPAGLDVERMPRVEGRVEDVGRVRALA